MQRGAAMRPELLSVIPPGVTRVLDVGCRTGDVGWALKRMGVSEVVGIEVDPREAARAREVLDRVIEADVEQEALDLADGTFDCLLYADVLEHLRDPWAVLQAHRRLLRPGGYVVCSIPNVRHVSVWWRLIRGRWTYTDHPGDVVSRWHLRFFALRDMVAMLRDAGYTVERVARTWSTRGKLASLFVLRDLFTVQYLIVARQRAARGHEAIGMTAGRRVLVTGGAGFVGSQLVRHLVEAGWDVRVLDSLEPQVHGPATQPVLPHGVAFIRGDVRDEGVVRRALDGVEVVVHLAAAVGVGQSLYEIHRYVSANSGGAAVLLEAIVRGGPAARVQKLVVASSMSVYGEGAYRCPACGPAAPRSRGVEQLARREWELRCEHCRQVVSPVPTPEGKALQPESVYAISKRDQEECCLVVGRAHRIPTVALRFFNVYGPGQALSNPYTGVLAIFATALLEGRAALVFEDGGQTRDFVHVRDVVRAIHLAIERPAADGHVLNVGSGRATTVLTVATQLAALIGRPGAVDVCHRSRAGDIRHCTADATQSRAVLGFEAQVPFVEGMQELVAWARLQERVDRTGEALRELEAYRLVR